ncbi:transposase [Sodalinema gerasimenkoae]|uniref:transposase n=1 Tax=Sodalinema gerasimenkoae TaxID=2862348 RepID=UPI00135694FE
MKLNQAECIAVLERIRWGGVPKCPYCGSVKSRKLKNEHRHQCNECYTSYSVTVDTIFHKTHASLWTWFLAIHYFEKTQGSITVRDLAAAIGVNKNTANRMLKALRSIPASERRWVLKVGVLVK